MDNTNPTSFNVPTDDESISVHKGIPKDHHWANIEGFVLQYAHEFPRKNPRPDNGNSTGLTNDEFIFIIQLSRFDFLGSYSVKPTLSTIARCLGKSLRTAHDYKQSCINAGALVVTSGKSTGSPSDYDFSPFYGFCYDRAIEDGWFYRTTLNPPAKAGGMQTSAQGGMQASARPGMQTSAQGGMQTSADIKDKIEKTKKEKPEDKVKTTVRPLTALTLEDANSVVSSNPAMAWYLVQKNGRDINPIPETPPESAEVWRIGETARAKELTAVSGGYRWHFMSAKTWLAYFGYKARWSFTGDTWASVYHTIENQWKNNISAGLNTLTIQELEALLTEITDKKQKFPYQTPTQLWAKIKVFREVQSAESAAYVRWVIIEMPDGEKITAPVGDPETDVLLERGGEIWGDYFPDGIER